MKLSHQQKQITTAYYVLKTGQRLNVTTETVRSLTGEPVDIITLDIGGLPVNFDSIKPYMKPEDANDLDEYLDNVKESNSNSAIAFCN